MPFGTLIGFTVLQPDALIVNTFQRRLKPQNVRTHILNRIWWNDQLAFIEQIETCNKVHDQYSGALCSHGVAPKFSEIV